MSNNSTLDPAQRARALVATGIRDYLAKQHIISSDAADLLRDLAQAVDIGRYDGDRVDAVVEAINTASQRLPQYARESVRQALVHAIAYVLVAVLQKPKSEDTDTRDLRKARTTRTVVVRRAK